MTDQEHGPTVQDAASRIASLPGAMLGFEDETPESAAPEGQDAPDDETSEADAPADDEDAAPAEASGEEDQDEGEPDEPAIAPPESWSEEDRAVWSSLPPEVQEVVARRERERDHGVSERLQSAATERQKAQEVQQAAQQQQQAYQDRLNQLLAHFRLAAQEPDPALLQTDEDAYLEAVKSASQAKDTLKFLEEQYGQLQAEQQAQQSQQFEAWKQEQAAELQKFWPEIFEQQELRNTVATSLINDYGYQPEEVKMMLDHRLYRLIKDAVAYRAASKAKPDATTRLKAKGKVVRPGTSEGPGKARAHSAEQQTRARLRKTGHVRDAAAAIANRIQL